MMKRRMLVLMASALTWSGEAHGVVDMASGGMPVFPPLTVNNEKVVELPGLASERSIRKALDPALSLWEKYKKQNIWQLPSIEKHDFAKEYKASRDFKTSL